MDNAKLQAAVKAAGLARLAPVLDRLVRPSVRLRATLAREAQMPIGASKLGGLPDLPAGVTWPEWHGLPQSFLMQLRLADLQPVLRGTLAGAFPEQGWLWFFYDAAQETYGADPADQGGWRVLFLDTDQPPLQRVPAPAALPAESRFRACALSFAVEETFSQQPDLDIPGLAWSNADQQRYEVLLADLAPAGSAIPRHRLLGFPDTIQDDMRLQCQLTSQGVTAVDDPRIEQLAPGAQDWQLLLQIDSDAQAGLRWASDGMLYYWLRRADAQARRFERSWLVLQSE
jgi:uncharacterized protein YwqG